MHRIDIYERETVCVFLIICFTFYSSSTGQHPLSLFLLAMNVSLLFLISLKCPSFTLLKTSGELKFRGLQQEEKCAWPSNLGFWRNFPMYVLDTVVRFHTTISAAIKVRMVIVRLRSQTSLYDDVSTGKCIPNSKQLLETPSSKFYKN